MFSTTEDGEKEETHVLDTPIGKRRKGERSDSGQYRERWRRRPGRPHEASDANPT